MFNLIVAVISIALVAALAAASIFYGGAAFSSGTAQAQASTLVNNGQQISGAQQLYMIANSGERNGVANLTDANGLVPNFLAAVPTPPQGVTAGDWTLSEDGTFAYIELDTNPAGSQRSPAAAVCDRVDEQGGDIISLADALDGANDAVNDILGADLQFGCAVDGDINDAADTAHFVYRL